VAVIEQSLHHFWQLYGDGSPIHERIGGEGTLAYLSDNPFGMLNPVTDVRLEPDAADVAITALVEAARRRAVDQWWWGGPGDLPADLGDRLVAAGLTAHDPSPGMSVSLNGWSAPPVPDGLAITRADGSIHAEFMRVVLEAFGLPEVAHEPLDVGLMRMAAAPGTPVVNLVGRLDGEPVACATVSLVDGIAGIWNVGTLEHARGRGVGTALTAAAMAAGAQRGAHTAVLIATTPGEPVYRAMGYRTVCEMPLWSLS
jgi:ribosomal protein S18 acetylase RimI-like enzyme